MGLEGVIAKIQKLRRLAASTSVHEAAAAAAAADRLLQEHGLVDAEIEAEGGAAREAPAEDPVPFAAWNALGIPTWQRQLAAVLFTHYGCAGYTEREKKRRYVLRIIGRPSDVEAARYMFAWLAVEIDRLAQERTGRGLGRRSQNAFCHGAVAGVTKALRESKRAAQAHASSAALVLVDQRAEQAKAAMHAAHRMRSSRSSVRIGDQAAFSEGLREGRALHDQQARARLKDAP